ncbi:type II secretion system F family protein [Kitasatospora sp. NPDC097643]|uniref:type II secretion system F family protein n=1 Tax=Kitasatospora sp. NPDC097643 TaxID=3157230 RepID=UPI00331B9DD3
MRAVGWVAAGAVLPSALLLWLARAVVVVRGRVLRRRRVRACFREWVGAPERTGGPVPVGPAARAGPFARGGGERLRRAGPAAGAGIGVALLLGGVAGVVIGVLLAAGLYHRGVRARTPTDRRAAQDEELLTRQLPLSAELLAACLGSADSPSGAVSAVGRSVGAPMGPRLVAIGAELALGAPPELCWGRLEERHPSLAPLARCLVRTSLGGAPAAGTLVALAREQRTAAARAAHARVRRAGVLATAPLGLCFLPAFVLIGVVPVVIGLTARFAQAM